MRSPPTTDLPSPSLYASNNAGHWPSYSRNTEEPAPWMLTQSPQALSGQYSAYYEAPHHPLLQPAANARPSSADSTSDPNWLPTPHHHQPPVTSPYSPRDFSAVNYQTILSPVSSSPPYDSRLTMDYSHPRAVSALITATPTLSTANPVSAPIDYPVGGPAASTALSYTAEVLRPARQGPIGSNVTEHEARTSNPVTLPVPVITSTRSGPSPSPPPAKRRRTTRRRSTASASTSGSTSSSTVAYSSSSSSFATASGFDSGIVCSLGSCSNEPFATIYLHARHVAHEHMVHSCSHIPEAAIAELKQWLVQQGGMTSASRESALKTYLKRKRDEREGMLECTRCGRVFGRKDARMKHVKKGGCVAGRPAPGTRTAIRRQTTENAPLSAASMVLPTLPTSIRVETNLPPPPIRRTSGDSPVATLVTLRDGTIAYGSPSEDYRLQPTYASVHTASPPASAYLTPSASYPPPQFNGYVFGSHAQDGATSQNQSNQQNGYVDPQFYSG